MREGKSTSGEPTGKSWLFGDFEDFEDFGDFGVFEVFVIFGDVEDTGEVTVGDAEEGEYTFPPCFT